MLEIMPLMLLPRTPNSSFLAHGENAEDGEEILNTDKEGSVFASQDFYKNAASGKPVSTMVKYNKKNYLL